MTLRSCLFAVTLPVLLAVAGCGDDTADSSEESESSPSAAADSDCPGGDIRFLQGAPTDLPGGGGAGIGTVDMDADPPTVDLVLGGARPAERDGAADLSVGDVFSVQGTDYEITQVCQSKVTVTEVK